MYLKNGTKGEEVKFLQYMLLSMGYDIGAKGANGIYGAKTEHAIRIIQEEGNIQVDGKDTAALLVKLAPHSLPPIGDKGLLVRERIYGSDGKAIKDIDYTDHGNPAEHSCPHKHDWDWNQKKKKKKKPRKKGEPICGININGGGGGNGGGNASGNNENEKEEEKVDDNITKKLFITGVLTGTAYVIYRGARLFPSLLPPFWWTIPGNLAIP